MKKREELKNILKGFREVGGITYSAVISRDGLVMVSDLAKGIDANTFAAMTAAMQGAAETSIMELNLGEITQIIIDSTQGKIISIGAGEQAILVVLAEKEANLGLILLSLSKASKRISHTLGGIADEAGL